MSVIQSCSDTNDALDFFRGQGLYLKPIARLNISVQLPQLKKSGAKISNWEVMERVKEMAKPFTFPVFKVAKSSLEFIRFEAEIENYGSMEQVLAKLDMKTIKLSGFQESLKVRAAESKPQFPTRYDWDNFFIENKDMNEMKPGERPDTIHVQNLPTKWFINNQDKSGVTKDKPSEFVLKRVFSSFGDIRSVDIPMLDPYREKMKSSISGIKTFSFGQDLVFEAYIQFMEYIGFVKAMNSLKGMKLMYKDRYEEKAWVANIKVDFDKTKSLAESTIKQRALEREKLIKQEREKDEAEEKRRELEEIKKTQERRQYEAEAKERERTLEAEQQEKRKRRMEREEKRRLKKLGLLETLSASSHDEEFVNEKIEQEERKLLVAQRKLESIRLLDELLERVKNVKSKVSGRNLEANLMRVAKSQASKFKSGEYMTYKEKDEKLIHDKLVNELKEKERQKVERFNERIRNARQNKRVDSSDGEESLEEVSEDEQGNGHRSDEEELRLTSTDDDDDIETREDEEDDDDGDGRSVKRRSDEDDDSDDDKRSKSKKKKKDKDREKKKSKKKEKKSRKYRKRDRDSSDESVDEDERKRKKMKKELENQISLAKKISAREHEKTPPPRPRNPRAFRDKSRMICYETVEDRKERGVRLGQEHEDFPAYIEKVMKEREQKRADQRMLKRMAELQQEEMYDKMMHPHLYGSSDNKSNYFKKPKGGAHYEETQQAISEEIKRKQELERKRTEQIRTMAAGGAFRYKSPPRRYQERFESDPRFVDSRDRNRDRDRDRDRGRDRSSRDYRRRY